MDSHPDSFSPEQWVDLFGDYLYQYAMARLHQPQRAEDAVQETFLAALDAYAGFDRRASVKTWLTGILKHKVVDQIRKSAREVPLTNAGDATSLEDLFNRQGHVKSPPAEWHGNPRSDLARDEFWACFHQCLARLPRPLADAFALREIEGLGREEICKVLGVTSTNYWVMLHRSRLKLRECLEKNWFHREKKGE